jgi:hypothetical protein
VSEITAAEDRDRIENAARRSLADELLTGNGLYAELFNLQAAGYR